MILMYHKVYPESPTMWWVTCDDFWRQMEQLRRFKVVPLDQYDPSDPRHAVITFDGVYENVFVYAFPILKRFGYPFELFVVGDMIGAGNDFDQQIEPAARFASSEQLKSMVGKGARLQWHGLKHRDLSQTTDLAEIEEELCVPQNIRHLDKAGFKWFGYPHGKHTPALVEKTRSLFSGGLSCVEGNDHDRYQLNRITAVNRTDFNRTTVSLIIPNYNYATYVAEAIESALHQTVKADEILFIDDCSTDNSVEIAERYKGHISIVKNEKNLGIVDNFNKAVSLTTGDYICFLGADNRFRSDYIEQCKYALDMHGEAAIAYTNIALFGPRAEVLANQVKALPLSDVKDYYLWSFPEFTEDARTTIGQKNFIHGSSMYRRTAFKAAGGYHKSGGPEDHNLFVRMLEKGYSAVLVPEFLLEYRQHSREQANVQLNYSVEIAYYRKQLKKKEDELRAVGRHFEELPHSELAYSLQDRGSLLTFGKIGMILGNYSNAKIFLERYLEFDPRNQEVSSYLQFLEKRIRDESSGLLKGRVEKKLPVKGSKVCQGLVSVIILTINELNYTKACFESIKKNTDIPYEIIFVDNGSSDGTVKWLRKLAHNDPKVKLIENKENLGFSKGCNQGMEASAGEYIVLLNNDVVVTGHWLSGMLECLNSAPDVGIVGPMTNNISGIQKVPLVEYETLKDLPQYALVFREKHRHRRIASRRVVGFCMLFRRELAEKIGLLDESFGSGNFEDDDYCYRAALEGYRNFVAGDVFIHHYGSRSFIGNRLDYREAMSGNRKIFDKKWSGIDISGPVGKKMLVLNAVEQARREYATGNLDNAVQHLIGAIKYAPEAAEIYHCLAELFIDAKKYPEALDSLESLPDEMKQVPKSLILRGYVFEGLERYPEALECAARVLSGAPADAQAYNLQGAVLFKQGNPGEAEECFRKAIEADPGYGEPHTNLGVILWAADRREKALDFLEKGFVLSPSVADSAVLYHAAVIAVEALERAAPVFAAARVLYPDNRQIAFLLIDLYLKLGRSDAAMQEIEQAMLRFGINDGILAAALEVRTNVGPMEPGRPVAGAQTLSLCMIVKNEEEHLAKCLMSVKPVVDEMIVVDTGSSDRTKEIAIAYGAKVYDFGWTEDFAAARNYSLSKATGTQILVLDADEVISSKDHQRIRDLIHGKSGGAKAFSLTTRNYTDRLNVDRWQANDGTYYGEEAGTGWYPSVKVRIFPNDVRIRFQNAVHEGVDPAILRAGITIEPCPVAVHHYGRLVSPEKIQAKRELYYRLGKKKVEEKGHDAKAFYELALAAGELEKFEEARDLWEEFISLDQSTPLAFVHLGSVYLRLGNVEKALEVSKKALALAPGLKEAVINYSLCMLRVADEEKAVPLLENLLETSRDYPLAVGVLAAAYSVTGARDKALGCFDRLRQLQADMTSFIDQQAEIFISLGKEDKARLLLETMIQANCSSEYTQKLVDACDRLRADNAQPSSSSGI